MGLRAMSAPEAGADRSTLERRLVVWIALHSFAVGCALLFLPHWSTRLAGWDVLVPSFFARQAGVFHFLVATGYLLEYFRNGTVTLLLLTKASAVLFLIINLIGLGMGPQAVGVLNDLAAPRFGDAAIRYSLLVVGFTSVWGAFHFAAAGRTLADDLGAADRRA